MAKKSTTSAEKKLPLVNKDNEAWCPSCGSVVRKGELVEGLREHGSRCDREVERYLLQRPEVA